MVRAVLLGLVAATLAVSGVACSKSGGSGPAVTAGVTVGVVVELAGTVTATRGGVSRPLKAGAEVSGDDVIATGADSKVAIELAHNGARWSLGASKQGQVNLSLAWLLPKATAPAAVVAQDTTAAGRHAEHASAETAASASAKKSDESPDVPSKADVAVPIVKPVPAATPTTATKQVAPKRTVPTKSPKPPPKLVTPRPPGTSAPRGTDRDKGDSLDEVIGGSSPGATSPRSPTSESTEVPLDQAKLKFVITSDAALRACFTTAEESMLGVACTAGKCTLKTASNVDASERTCLDQRFAKLVLPVGTAPLTFTIRIRK